MKNSTVKTAVTQFAKKIPWRVLLFLAVVLGAGSVVVIAQSQQDVASVRQAVERHYAAINAGDENAVQQQHLPEFSHFSLRGGLLRSSDEQSPYTQVPVTFNQRIRHFAAQVYGNVAVATYYLVGSVKFGEESLMGTWRVTEVWVRQGGEWKEAHHHESPLQDGVR
jgi:ketosteroid isomerase-like protein